MLNEGLSQEMKQIDNFFCFNVRKYNRKTTKFFDEHLKKLGVRSTQIHLLLVLSAGNKNITETSEELGMDRSTLTRGLSPLERIGLIKRLESENHRSKVYALTEYGQDMARQGTVLLQEAEDIIVSRLGNERYTRMVGDLAS